MEFSLSEEQRMLIDTVRRFVREELHPLEAEVEANGALAPEKARSIFAKSKALGLYGLNIPAEFGGGGLSAVDTMLCEEQFGHTTDILIRRAFGNVYEALLACRGEQIERWLKPAARSEWFIKTAIVILGASLGVKAAGAGTLVTAIMFRGLAAIIEAYLIYWSLVYLIARKFFGFSREWAAPLASGISICGVSAAITTGAAIRARREKTKSSSSDSASRTHVRLRERPLDSD